MYERLKFGAQITRCVFPKNTSSVLPLVVKCVRMQVV